MRKTICSFFTLMAFVIYTVGCASVRLGPNDQLEQLPPSLFIEARLFPEVRLATNDGTAVTAKILHLKGDRLTLLPSPYWNVLAKEIALGEVTSIRLIRKKRGWSAGFVGGFLFGFYLAGFACLVSAKYDEDYESGMLLAPFGGLYCGLVGLVIGGLADLAKKSSFNFSRMSSIQKISILKEIMGGY